LTDHRIGNAVKKQKHDDCHHLGGTDTIIKSNNILSF